MKPCFTTTETPDPMWNWTEEKLGLFSTALDQSKHTTAKARDNDEYNNNDESFGGVFRVLAIGGSATEISLDPLARIAKHVFIEAPPHRTKLEVLCVTAAAPEDVGRSEPTPALILDALRTKNHFDATALAAAEACIVVDGRVGSPLEALASPGSLQLSYGFETTHRIRIAPAPTTWALFPTCPCDHPNSTLLNSWRSQAQSELREFVRARHAELAPGGFFCGSLLCLERGRDSTPWSRFGSFVKSFAIARAQGFPLLVRHEPHKDYNRRNWPSSTAKRSEPQNQDPTLTRKEKIAQKLDFLRKRVRDKVQEETQEETKDCSIDFRTSIKAEYERLERLQRCREKGQIESAKKPRPGRAVLPMAFRTRDEVLAAFGTGWKVWRCKYVLAEDPAKAALSDAEASIPKALVSEARRTYVQHLVETFKAACLSDLVQSSLQERKDYSSLDDSNWLECSAEAKDQAKIFWEAACDDCAEAILREYEESESRWPLHERYHLGVPSYLLLAQKCY